MDGLLLSLMRIEFLAVVIEILVCTVVLFYALKVYRLTASLSALALNLSFTLLLVGSIIYGATVVQTLVLVRRPDRAQASPLVPISVTSGYFIRLGLEIAAYVLLGIASLYSRRIPPAILAAAAAPVSIKPFIPFGELLVTVVLIFVCGVYLANAYSKKTFNSFFVFLGFALIFSSHVALAFAPSLRLYLFSHVLEISGFLCFLTTLLISLYSQGASRR